MFFAATLRDCFWTPAISYGICARQPFDPEAISAW
jgi:hypothetical protein